MKNNAKFIVTVLKEIAGMGQKQRNYPFVFVVFVPEWKLWEIFGASTRPYQQFCIE
jgi:hypothetical protein